uniref:Uncharacterized protein n=1 Tax=Arundo donax TaxID=35708 RepID=A0A0A8YX23_ARUDO
METILPCCSDTSFPSVRISISSSLASSMPTSSVVFLY